MIVGRAFSAEVPRGLFGDRGEALRKVQSGTASTRGTEDLATSLYRIADAQGVQLHAGTMPTRHARDGFVELHAVAAGESEAVERVVGKLTRMLAQIAR